MTTRNVLITGAGGGVGRALAVALADRGWRVFAGVRSPAAAPPPASGVEPIELDITDDSQVATAARAVERAVGRAGLQGLVNNAGVIVQGPLELVPANALRRQFEVNVIGQVSVTQALLPLLRRGGGTIVNLGAPTGRVTVPMAGPISASKAALGSLTDALRMELKHQGVKVTIVEPGALETEIFDKAAARIKAAPVDGVVATIAGALDAPRPDARYVVGRDAHQLAMLRRLPRALRDRVLMGAVGLKPALFDSGELAERAGS